MRATALAPGHAAAIIGKRRVIDAHDEIALKACGALV
jgi:hypothetical protein